MTRYAALVALVATAAPGLAAAQTPGATACEAQRPSDPCHPEYEDYEEADPGIIPVVVERPVRRGFERRGAPRIHGALMDTGHLLPAGSFQAAGRVYGTLAQAAIGLHERLELSSDLIAFGLVGASIGFRASLTDPESPFRAVGGAKVWAITGSAMRPVQLSATLGYQHERVNVHANLVEMPSEDGRVWVLAAGVVFELSEVVSLVADAGRIDVGTDEFVEGTIAGVKLTGEKFDLDLTVAVNDEGALPLVGLTGRI